MKTVNIPDIIYDQINTMSKAHEITFDEELGFILDTGIRTGNHENIGKGEMMTSVYFPPDLIVKGMTEEEITELLGQD